VTAVSTRVLVSAVALVLGAGTALGAPVRAETAPPGAAAEGTAALTRDEARTLESPIPYGEESIREGRKHYLRLCQSCHGRDGRALENFDFEATDLTAPERWRHGSSDGDLFFSTREGAGMDMPPFKEKLTDEQVWQVVWFLRSLGPASARPQAMGGAAGEAAEASANETAARAPDGGATEP
jgi:mono/diheme cytochrome c family protein